MHDFIHDESGTCHIARIFHKGDESIEYQDVGKEYDDTSHTSDYAVYQQVFQRSFAHVASYKLTDPAYERLDPSHRVFADTESRFKHNPHEEDKDRET